MELRERYFAGTGSVVPGGTEDLQEKTRRVERSSPRARPWRATAWREYSEQAG
jgi:hypothetical protein